MAVVEQRILRALLASLYDSKEELELPPGTSDTVVLAIARHHRLSPALAMLSVSHMSHMLVDQFHADRLVTLGRGTLLRQALVEITAGLNAYDVETAILKGMAYEAMAYPIPGTRPATDIDLLVHPEARSNAFEVFRQLGFVPCGGAPGYDESDYHEVSLRRGDTYVDLHFGLAPFVRGAIDYQALWSATVALPLAGPRARALSRPHAALHQALHMAIHHFDIPALYLLDLARLVTAPSVCGLSKEAAGTWRCLRAWETATALAAFFIPAAVEQLGTPLWRSVPRIERVIRSFGGISALPRAEQIRRKMDHFDNSEDAARYLLVQGRRVVREKIIALNSTPPSPATRLAWRPVS